MPESWTAGLLDLPDSWTMLESRTAGLLDLPDGEKISMNDYSAIPSMFSFELVLGGGGGGAFKN